MTNGSLAASYLTKARLRLTILPTLFDGRGYSDVVREAQEIVELALKGMLRQVGIEPPKFHDVGPLVRHHSTRFPLAIEEIDRLAEISAWLRKEREFAFDGDIDLIPTEHYTADHATRAMTDAEFAVRMASRVIHDA